MIIEDPRVENLDLNQANIKYYFLVEHKTNHFGFVIVFELLLGKDQNKFNELEGGD